MKQKGLLVVCHCGENIAIDGMLLDNLDDFYVRCDKCKLEYEVFQHEDGEWAFTKHPFIQTSNKKGKAN
jgi:hypothetical protein